MDGGQQAKQMRKSNDFSMKEVSNGDNDQEKTVVFDQLCPEDRYQDNDYCLVCEKHFSLLQTKKICRFCGYFVCPDCSPKKRENPQGKGSYVRICDMCDEKFLRAILQRDYKIDQKLHDKAIKQNEEDFKALKQRYEQKLNELQEVKNQTHSESNSQKDKVNQIQQEIDNLNLQIEKYDKRYQVIKAEELGVRSQVSEKQNELNEKKQQLEQKKSQLKDTRQQIEDYDNRIQELQRWVMNVTQQVSIYNIDNKTGNSFLNSSVNHGAKDDKGDRDQGTQHIVDEDLFFEDEDSDNDFANSLEFKKLVKLSHLENRSFVANKK